MTTCLPCGGGVSYPLGAAQHSGMKKIMTGILVRDHAEVGDLFGELWPAFENGGAQAVFEKLDYLWARLAVHIRAEHLHLFPALLAASAGRGGAPTQEEMREVIERLREDHDFFMRELAAAVNDSRELASQAGGPERERLTRVESRARAVAARLDEHNRVEEEHVYRWPEPLLPEAQLELLRAAMRREIENLPPRFPEGRRR